MAAKNALRFSVNTLFNSCCYFCHFGRLHYQSSKNMIVFESKYRPEPPATKWKHLVEHLGLFSVAYVIISPYFRTVAGANHSSGLIASGLDTSISISLKWF